jgi:superfamily I DNA and/or RNA helicase
LPPDAFTHNVRLALKGQIPPDLLREFQGAAVVWVDIPWCNKSGCEEYAELRDPPFTNEAEAAAVQRLYESLTFATNQADPPEIVFLSPYRHQVALLDQVLRSVEAKGRLPLRSPHRDNTRAILANTVDAFQGNEADIVCISIVRNNKPGDGGLGFLKERERMNVMVSRARKLLVFVGSWAFFKHETNSFKHHPNHKGHHLYQLRCEIESLFASKGAVRLPLDWIPDRQRGRRL